MPDMRAAPAKSSSLWHNRDFLLLWNGQIVSAIGSQVSLIAFPWLILAITGSPAQAGLTAAIRTLPYILFGLPAGALQVYSCKQSGLFSPFCYSSSRNSSWHLPPPFIRLCETRHD